MDKIKLIMLSGGLDSAYVLYKTLKETSDKVWAHHIILKNLVEVRWKEELESTKKIVEYCKKIRQFGYSESEWGFNFKQYLGWDIDLVVFTAAQIIPNIYQHGKVTLVTGRVKEDDQVPTSLSQTVHTQAIWEAAIKKHERRVEKEISKPIRHLSKKDIIQDIPKELFDMVWYCRRSDEGKPCGRCRSCKDIQRAIDEINQEKVKGIKTNENLPQNSNNVSP